MARNDAEHVQAIIDNESFNRRPAPTSTLRTNCTQGYKFTIDEQAKGQAEFHHILPIETLGDSYMIPTEYVDFFHDCMAITTWDINDGHNLIGLPTRNVYENAERNNTEWADKKASSWTSSLRNAAAQLGMFGVLPDLPCHEIEHNPDYNQGVIDYLQKQVWQPLAKARRDCAVDPKSIRGQLRSASDKWRSFLVSRGAEVGGASHCWVNRNEAGYASKWYKPFSMNPGTPRRVPPPPPLADRSGSVSQWLKSLIPER